jgi:hypothetical protein
MLIIHSHTHSHAGSLPPFFSPVFIVVGGENIFLVIRRTTLLTYLYPNFLTYCLTSFLSIVKGQLFYSEMQKVTLFYECSILASHLRYHMIHMFTRYIIYIHTHTNKA